jgi:hypothetical protein
MIQTKGDDCLTIQYTIKFLLILPDFALRAKSGKNRYIPCCRGRNGHFRTTC